jgi:hypothetical protein
MIARKKQRKRRQPLGIRFCAPGERLSIADLHDRYWACLQRLSRRRSGGKAFDLALDNLRGEMGIISTALSYAQQANDPWVAWSWCQGYRESVESFYQSLGGADLHRRVALYRLLRMQLRCIAGGEGPVSTRTVHGSAERELALLARYGMSVETPIVPQRPSTWRWYLQHQTTLLASDASSETEWYRCGSAHYIVSRGFLLRELSRFNEAYFKSLYEVLVDPDRRVVWFAQLAEYDRRLAANASAWGKPGIGALPTFALE